MSHLTVDFVAISDGRRLHSPARHLGSALGLAGVLVGTREFTEGKSDTRVILVEHRRSPKALARTRLVFKFGRASGLAREVQRFEALRPHIKATSVFAELLDPQATRQMLEKAFDDVGAIAYRYVPDQLAVEESAGTIEALVRDAITSSSNVVPWPAACPHRVAAALHGLLDSPRSAFGAELVHHYESRWLPDLRIAIPRAVDIDGLSCPLLHHGVAEVDMVGLHDSLTDPGALADWCRGGPAVNELRRPGLEVLGRWDGIIYTRDHDAEVTLALVPEASARPRVSALKRGDRVAIWVRREQVEATRAELHAIRAREAAPGWLHTVPRVRLGRWITRNPLRLDANVIASDDEIPFGPCHGDLHAGNVFIAGDGPMFIDYGLAEPAPVGTDVARLVGSLFRNVLALHLNPAALIETAAVLVGLLDPEHIVEHSARRAIALVNPWRNAWMKIAKEPSARWARHLYGFALIGLKWIETTDASTPRRHLSCLLLAALADCKLHGQPSDGELLDPLAQSTTLVDSVENPLVAYFQYVKNTHTQVVPFFQPSHYPEEAPLSLEAVYVELAITPERQRDCEGDDVQVTPRSLQTLLSEADTGKRCWLLLGEPGAGKSTLARHLVASLAAANAQEKPIGVYVSLAEWAPFAEDVFAFTEAMVTQASQRAALGLAQYLRDQAKAGRLWLLLDGFDEVAPEHVEWIQRRILALADHEPALVIAVLSRPIGARPLRGFAQARLLPLNRAQQLTLLSRWLGPSRGARLLSDIQHYPALRTSSGNPLLLSLVAKVVSEEGALPETRSELFSAALDLLIDRGHGITPRGLGVHSAVARQMLRPLSLSLTEAGGEAWTLAFIKERVEALEEGDADAERALTRGWATIDQFLSEIARRTGVLGPHDGSTGRWRYLHRALRERLAAEALVGRGAERIAAHIRAIADDNAQLGRWGETLGMACVMLDDPSAPLRALRAVGDELTLRVLPELTGLSPAIALNALFAMEADAGFTWNGDTLLKLARRWPLSEAVARLTELVHPTLDLDLLAFIHFTLRELGKPPERAEFFARAGRPVERVPAFKMVTVPAGTFCMGSSESETGRWTDETPHSVTVTAPYSMGITPVTRAEYMSFDPEHQCRGGKDHPVTLVSWWRATLYASWANATLPTEAQWEYACRAGTTTAYWSGNTEVDLARVGWYDANSDEQAHQVGCLPANPLGLYDMHGNVWEWCTDWTGPYPQHAAVDPVGPPSGELRVCRGGSWRYDARSARSAYRDSGDPSIRGSDLGLRLVRVA